ncbi:hypothetical protein KA012_02300 [Candidatus Woesebacteria bacterium]|nr:hypothetical protein [Candidatus Woesebacteria bacterium]
MSGEISPTTPTSDVAPTTPQSDQAGSEPQPKKGMEKVLARQMNRRAALRMILFGAAGVGVVGAGAGAAIAEAASPGFLAKLARAITSGKLFGDMREVAVSRLKLHNEQFQIARFEKIADDQKEPWMEVVSPNIWVAEIIAKQENNDETHLFLLADVTTTTKVYDLPISTQAALADLVLAKQCMILPAPHYRIPANQLDGRRIEYLFAAEQASGDHLDQSQIPAVAKRGGLVLDSSGVLSVVTPTRMEEVYAATRSDSATNAPQMIMEYAFVIDSREVRASLETVENAKGGPLNLKDLAYSVEYMNFLVTMYDANDVPQTFIFATYVPQRTSQQTAEQSTARQLNLYQVTDIIERLRQQLDQKRFVIAVPDPSEVSISFVPQEPEADPQAEAGENSTRRLRSLGTDSPYSKVAPRMQTFRWVLASHRDTD